MDAIDLRTLADAVGGQLRGGEAEAIRDVSIDSRSCGDAEVFFALAGAQLDGHDFVPELAGRAAAAVVEEWVDSPLPQCRVFSTRGALAALGRWNRERCGARVVGLTGSNGKTTVKEMLRCVLGEAGETAATVGNYNNELGVPLSLCRLASRHDYAVIEMGANAHGDIAHLAGMARPHVGLITNASAAHLKGFGSLAGVATAKGELYSALNPEGIAIVNAEDRFADRWRRMIGDRRCLSFAADNSEADVVARRDGDKLVLELAGHRLTAAFALPGRHNRLNAAAAAAVAKALDVPDSAISAGLARVTAVAGRLAEWSTAGGATLIDDSYNANPGSLAAAQDVLAERSGERLLVLGDMAELGPESEAFHQAAGEDARERGIDGLLALGDQAQAAARGFGEGAEAFADQDALVTRLLALDRPGRVFLVKGSRLAAMDHVAAALRRGGAANEQGDGDASAVD